MGKIIGYTRVSTDSQADHGEGLTTQIAAISAWAEYQGRKVAEWYTDTASGASIEERDGLIDAVGALKKGDTLIVSRIDRLARDLVAQETILGMVWRRGANVASCMESETVALQPDDPSDPARKLIRQVLGAVAEYERAVIRVRCVAGRRRKLAETGWAGGAVGIDMVYDPVLRDARLTDEGREMREFVLDLWENGVTFREITARFNEKYGTSHVHATIWRMVKRAQAADRRARERAGRA